MTSVATVQLCVRLGREADPDVRAIARRCLAAFTEFTGLRYARLTAAEAQRLQALAETARLAEDPERASLLEAGAAMILEQLRIDGPAAEVPVRTKPPRGRRAPGSSQAG